MQPLLQTRKKLSSGIYTLPGTIHQKILFLCLIIFAVALPTSRAVVSIVQIILFLNWLAEGNYRQKVTRFIEQKHAVLLTAIFFLYAIGLLWSQDPAYGVSVVLKNKIPYLSLVFIISSSPPLPREKIRVLPFMFVCAVIFTSILGFCLYLSDSLRDPRELSPFVLHVHFSMMIVLAIALIPWMLQSFRLNKVMYYAAWMSALWLVAFLIIMSTLTAIISLVLIAMILLMCDLKKCQLQQHTMIMAAFALILFLSLVFSIAYVSRPLRKEINPRKAELEATTSMGNSYTHHISNDQRENGHLVFYFIAEDELRAAWNERSELGFYGHDHSGNKLRYTIYRYLSSRGYRKDREALEKLSKSEVEAIEKGIPNYLYKSWPNVFVRIHQTMWELQEYARTGDPRGGTMAQRIEAWKATIQAIKEKPLLGWGTGGHLSAIHFGLEETGSLYKNFDLRHSHNQFLHVLVSFGMIGFIVFYGLLFLFLKRSKALKAQPYQVLLAMTVVFMFGHAPLESQMPLNLFLFFSVYFGILLNNSQIVPQKPENK